MELSLLAVAALESWEVGSWTFQRSEPAVQMVDGAARRLLPYLRCPLTASFLRAFIGTTRMYSTIDGSRYDFPATVVSGFACNVSQCKYTRVESGLLFLELV